MQLPGVAFNLDGLAIPGHACKIMTRDPVKVCADCGQTKSVEEFHKGGVLKNGEVRRVAKCKECSKRYWREVHYPKHRAKRIQVSSMRMKEQRKITREWVDTELKNKPCTDCGVQYSPWVMEFDHRDPEVKSFSIGAKLRSNCSKELLLREIAKCDLVCANCHREREYQRFQARKSNTE